MKCKIVHKIKIRALFLGRFQPFHLGHVHAVKQILQECDFVTIAIGSSQEHDTQRNPFSKEQREGMIKLALGESGVPKEKYGVIFIPDIMWHEKYVEHVKSYARFDVFYASEENHTIQLFRAAGEKVRVLKKLENVSATQIRDIAGKAKNKKELEKLRRFLPGSVLIYFLQEGLDKRLKEISS